MTRTERRFFYVMVSKHAQFVYRQKTIATTKQLSPVPRRKKGSQINVSVLASLERTQVFLPEKEDTDFITTYKGHRSIMTRTERQ